MEFNKPVPWQLCRGHRMPDWGVSGGCPEQVLRKWRSDAAPRQHQASGTTPPASLAQDLIWEHHGGWEACPQVSLLEIMLFNFGCICASLGGLVKMAPNSKPGNKNLNNRVLKMFLKKKKPFHYAAKAETPVFEWLHPSWRLDGQGQATHSCCLRSPGNFSVHPSVRVRILGQWFSDYQDLLEDPALSGCCGVNQCFRLSVLYSLVGSRYSEVAPAEGS